jgi:hypothetical protein
MQDNVRLTAEQAPKPEMASYLPFEDCTNIGNRKDV